MPTSKAGVLRADSPAHTSPVYQTSVRVRYAETDQMGVVYHSNYIVWFEVGRVEMLRQLGFCYSDMEKLDDTHIAVVDVRCRYKAPARYDDVINIRSWFIHVRDSLLHFGYELVRASDGTIVAEGESVHIVVDSTLKWTKLPAKYLDAFKTAVTAE
ncbi:MAG: acyl-CoA thioesterase [Deltaproteobacteria bacterium]|nr:acyl-CoA thioesterase [Deltaproteobacteria bacterium]